MQSNVYFLAKFRFDTAENEPAKNLQNFVRKSNFAKNNSKIANFPNFANKTAVGRGRRIAAVAAVGRGRRVAAVAAVGAAVGAHRGPLVE